jgi:hypothetical protein
MLKRNKLECLSQWYFKFSQIIVNDFRVSPLRLAPALLTTSLKSDKHSSLLGQIAMSPKMFIVKYLKII